MVIAIVGELIIRGRKSLKALSRNRRKIPSELGELSQYHCTPSHKTVYERFLTHLLPPRSGLPNSLSRFRVLERENNRLQLSNF